MVISLLRSLPVTLMVAEGCWLSSQVKFTDAGLTVSVGLLGVGLEPVAMHPQWNVPMFLYPLLYPGQSYVE